MIVCHGTYPWLEAEWWHILVPVVSPLGGKLYRIHGNSDVSVVVMDVTKKHLIKKLDPILGFTRGDVAIEHDDDTLRPSPLITSHARPSSKHHNGSELFCLFLKIVRPLWVRHLRICHYFVYRNLVEDSTVAYSTYSEWTKRTFAELHFSSESVGIRK